MCHVVRRFRGAIAIYQHASESFRYRPLTRSSLLGTGVMNFYVKSVFISTQTLNQFDEKLTRNDLHQACGHKTRLRCVDLDSGHRLRTRFACVVIKSSACVAAGSKLTRSKSVPLTDEQIRRHREQRNHRDQWQADVAALQSIVDRLRAQYAKHKGDFAIGRYEELKVWIHGYQRNDGQTQQWSCQSATSRRLDGPVILTPAYRVLQTVIRPTMSCRPTLQRINIQNV